MNKATKEAQILLPGLPIAKDSQPEPIPVPNGWQAAKGWKQIEVHKERPCKLLFHDGFRDGFIGDPVTTYYNSNGFYVRLNSGSSIVVTHFSSVLFEIVTKKK